MSEETLETAKEEFCMLYNRYNLCKLLGYSHKHFSQHPLERDYEFMKACECVQTYYYNGFQKNKSKDNRELITLMSKFKASIIEHHDRLRRGLIYYNQDYNLATCYTRFWGRILPPVLGPRHN